MVSVGGREFEVKTVSDSQFYALAIEDDDDGSEDRNDTDATPPNLDGQTVFLLERASYFDAEFVSTLLTS